MIESHKQHERFAKQWDNNLRLQGFAGAFERQQQTKSSLFQVSGLNIFRGLAVILIVWFGVKAALSAAHGHGGCNFAKFADLLLLISFGLGMTTYYSRPIPGVGYSFSDLITKEALSLSGSIENGQAQQIVDAVVNSEQQLGAPPGVLELRETILFFIIAISLALMQALAFAVVAYGYVAAAVCLLMGPIFIPFFIVPKLDFLFWGWFKAFIGFSFYQVVASAFIYVFSKALLGMLGVIGPLNLSNAWTILPALFLTIIVCAYGLRNIPDLTPQSSAVVRAYRSTRSKGDE